MGKEMESKLTFTLCWMFETMCKINGAGKKIKGRKCWKQCCSLQGTQRHRMMMCRPFLLNWFQGEGVAGESAMRSYLLFAFTRCSNLDSRVVCGLAWFGDAEGDEGNRGRGCGALNKAAFDRPYYICVCRLFY